MNVEKFNPNNPDYKKVEDLPQEEQVNFKNVEGGFVKNTAPEDIEAAQSDEEYLRELPDDAEREKGRIEQWEQLVGNEETAEIRELIGWSYEPTKKMLEPILENIKNGDYQLLIGDDASGRIPALIVRKFINNAYKHANRPAILTRFIAGSKADDDIGMVSKSSIGKRTGHYVDSGEKVRSLKVEKWKKVKSYIKKLKDESSPHIDNAIVVTEYIEHGDGLIPVMMGLRKNAITATLLTVYMDAERLNEADVERVKDFIEKKLHPLKFSYGKASGGMPAIYKQYDLSGVFKHFSDLHAIPFRGNELYDAEYFWKHGKELTSAKEVILAKMAIARDEANRVAERLIAELLPSEEEPVSAIPR